MVSCVRPDIFLLKKAEKQLLNTILTKSYNNYNKKRKTTWQDEVRFFTSFFAVNINKIKNGF